MLNASDTLDAPPAFSFSVNLASLCLIIVFNGFFVLKLDYKVIQGKYPSLLRTNFKTF